MSITTALTWRYATKKMNGIKIPNEKLEIILNAIALAPSSFGLQPYSVFVIEDIALLEKIKPIASNQSQITDASALLVFAAWDKLSQQHIDDYFARIAKVRDVSLDSLQSMKEHIETQLQNTDVDNFIWNAKQTYIALGFALVAAAEEYVDSTPMEGFDKKALDELLQLKEKGLASTVILPLGYRDTANDYLAKLKKVRREKDQLFIRL
ncbi:NAD(P)H-dependent oxidoreductase [Flavobacterium sp.]|uniref:NAD(P)H-dependent oxidoreductase n=1 Tax=Flavobacterium sp. TaxID=239 RepID=UPI0026372ADE|nr:NAD(P)H-dependent oxidoreductase [Flavobacterium sp.]